MPDAGTVEKVNYCTYQADISRSAERRNRWLKLAEEAEYELYLVQRGYATIQNKTKAG